MENTKVLQTVLGALAGIYFVLITGALGGCTLHAGIDWHGKTDVSKHVYTKK
jgi:hypothetical protein